MRIHFLTLKTFSATGGIEKLSRIIGKVLVEIDLPAAKLHISSLYDKKNEATEPYFNPRYFSGLGGSKLRWLWWAVTQGRRADVVIASHANILPLLGWVKRINKKIKIVLVAHGIEVWRPLKQLALADYIIAVSQYTASQLIKINQIAENKITVINNCLDPFLEPAANGSATQNLKDKMGIPKNASVLFALTRLAATERYKGYDRIIQLIGKIKKEKGIDIHYVLAGKYSLEEKQFIEHTAASASVSAAIHLPGFISDENVPLYFGMADAYVLPSRKEGFGITFIEAMYYGLPVIAGNEDGSVDALLNGRLGILVSPTNDVEIEIAILKMLDKNIRLIPDKSLLTEHFSFESYKLNWERFLENCIVADC